MHKEIETTPKGIKGSDSRVLEFCVLHLQFYSPRSAPVTVWTDLSDWGGYIFLDDTVQNSITISVDS